MTREAANRLNEPVAHPDGSFDVDVDDIHLGKGDSAQQTLVKVEHQNKVLGFYSQGQYIRDLVEGSLPGDIDISLVKVDPSASSPNTLRVKPETARAKVAASSPSDQVLSLVAGRLGLLSSEGLPLVRISSPDGYRYFHRPVFEAMSFLWSEFQPQSKLEFGTVGNDSWLTDETVLNPATDSSDWTLKDWLQHHLRPR